MRSSDERTWAILAYVLPLAVSALSAGFGWIAALIIWAVYRERSGFVAGHAVQSLALTVFTFLLGWIGAALAVTLILLPISFLLWIAAGILGIVLPILGAIAASKGRDYRAPVVGGAFRALMR